MRSDLFFRLNVVRIDVPLLRERPEDIPVLAQHFLDKYATELGRRPPRLRQSVLDRLLAYAWPGNVRELENLMERAAVLCPGDEITEDLLPADVSRAGASAATTEVAEDSPSGSLVLHAQVEALEKKLIEQALLRSNNNKAAAARLLEISERALWYKLKRHGL